MPGTKASDRSLCYLHDLISGDRPLLSTLVTRRLSSLRVDTEPLPGLAGVPGVSGADSCASAIAA
jgi:hypothetical protein